MPYIFAIIASVSFASGYGVAYKAYSGQIDALNIGISASNQASKQLLATETAKVKASEENALKLNSELDMAHESDIATINAIHDQLVSARLHDNHQASRTNPVPVRPSPSGTAKNDETDGGLSTEATGFLLGESYRADKITVDYNLLLAFVSNNCGIYARP
jgi:hypothetical protein